MSQIWMSHVTYVALNEHVIVEEHIVITMCEWNMSHTYVVKSHIRISHVTHTNESCHTYKWVVGTHVNESCHTYEWVMSHVWMSHVTRMHESCHVRSYTQACEWRRAHKDHYVWMRYVTNLLVRDFKNWNTSCHTCEWVIVTHMNESCHTYEWVMSHNESCHTYEWVMSHIWMSHVKHLNESCHTHDWVMSHT